VISPVAGRFSRFVGKGFSEPQVAVRTGGNADRTGVGSMERILGYFASRRRNLIYFISIVSVNHKLPSGPVVMPHGLALAVGILYTVMLPSFGKILQILFHLLR